ncbi:MAG: phage major capsid protein [Pseudomonadota bacterium]
MENIAELLEERDAKAVEMRQIHDTAEKAERDLADQEHSRFNTLAAEVKALDLRIARAKRVAELERQAPAEPVTPERDSLQAAAQDYSLLAAIRSLCPDMATQTDAGREREISQELARRAGKKTAGLMVPMSVFHKRVITTEAPVGGPGGNIIAEDLLPGQMIDILRSRLVIAQRGARVLSGLTGNVTIPKQTGSSTGYWVAENSPLTASDLELGQVTMAPKHVGALTEFSRNMLLQSSPDVEQLVRADFAAVLARAVDRAALHGGGTNEPEGILATSGIGSVEMATATWAKLLEFIETLAVEDADQGSLGWATNPKVVRLLRSTLKVGGDAGAGYLMAEPGMLAGYPLSSSNLVPANLTDGGSPEAFDRSALIFGNWADLLIGYWSAFEILVNPYEANAYAKGNVKVRGLMTMDVEVRHAESFAVATDIDTAA